MSIILSVVFLIISGYFFVNNQDGIFSKFSGRAMVNTRDGVVLCYVLDMDENPDNWIYGKGIQGDYFVPIAEGGDEVDAVGTNRKSEYRLFIECGYLQMILNGGLIYVALFLLIVLPALYLGFFRSKNVFSKACAFLILLWLVDMVPFGLPVFAWRYFLVWFAIGICYSKGFRMKSDQEIKDVLKEDSSLKIDRHI